MTIQAPSPERAARARPRTGGIGALARDDHGSVLAEFGLVLPLLLFMLFGVFEFGFAFWVKHTVTHAAREGARFAIVRGLESGRTADSAAVANHVKDRAGLQPITVRTTWDDATKISGTVVQVRVEYPFQPLSPLGILAARTISSTSRMVISF